MINVNAYTAESAGSELVKFEYDLPNIENEQVHIKVHYCGLCHSDMSIINNE